MRDFSEYEKLIDRMYESREGFEYSKEYYECLDHETRLFSDNIKDLLKPLLRPQGVILDVGYWFGGFPRALRKNVALKKLNDAVYVGIDTGINPATSWGTGGTDILKHANEKIFHDEIFNSDCYSAGKKRAYERFNSIFLDPHKSPGINIYVLSSEPGNLKYALGSHETLNKLFSKHFLKDVKFDCIVMRYMARWICDSAGTKRPLTHLGAIQDLREYARSFIIIDYKRSGITEEKDRDFGLVDPEEIEIYFKKGYEVKRVEGRNFFAFFCKRK